MVKLVWSKEGKKPADRLKPHEIECLMQQYPHPHAEQGQPVIPSSDHPRDHHRQEEGKDTMGEYATIVHHTAQQEVTDRLIQYIRQNPADDDWKEYGTLIHNSRDGPPKEYRGEQMAEDHHPEATSSWHDPADEASRCPGHAGNLQFCEDINNWSLFA